MKKLVTKKGMAASALVVAATLAILVIAPVAASARSAQAPSVQRVVAGPDWALCGGSGCYWALDNFTAQQFGGSLSVTTCGSRYVTTDREEGTFTATIDPQTGATLSSPVHGSFTSTMTWDWYTCSPISLDNTYIGPKGWVFTETMPGGVYAQSENFPLEDAIP